MNKYFYIFLIFSSSLHAAAVYDGKPLPEDEKERCKIGVIEMIKIYESGLENIGYEEHKQERESKINNWKNRLNTDENPCIIYTEAFNHAFEY